MLPTDPYDPTVPEVGPQGMQGPGPQGGPGPQDMPPTFLMDSQPVPEGPHPAQSLMEAAMQRQQGPMWGPPQGGMEDMFGAQEELQQRQRPRRMPRPDPLRAAALIELGKLMAENGRTMKQHHALLEAYHALKGPNAREAMAE